jgi:hypothetical protein
MGDRKHAPKRSAQNINNSLTNSPVKSVQSKIPKRNDTKEVKEEEKDENVKEMFEIIMSKLSKLDIIDSRMESIEKDLNEVKNSVEFVHAEVQDLKKENEKAKKTEGEVQQKLEKLEQINSALNHRVID